jgi:hypothetical protein
LEIIVDYSTRISQFNSEDTQLCSFKVFFALSVLLHGQRTDAQHLPLLPCSEAECIVFIIEGLLLAHDLGSTAEPYLIIAELFALPRPP